MDDKGLEIKAKLLTGPGGIFRFPELEERYYKDRAPKQGRLTWAKLGRNRAPIEAALAEARKLDKLRAEEAVVVESPTPMPDDSEDLRAQTDAAADSTLLDMLPEHDLPEVAPSAEPPPPKLEEISAALMPIASLPEVEVKPIFVQREAYLYAAVAEFAPWLQREGHEIPKIRVSCGFPKFGKGGRGATIGQCWYEDASNDGAREIFISPVLEGEEQVLTTLLHELVHSVLPKGTGHKGEFIKVCKALGFTKPWTQTPATDALLAQIKVVSDKLGEYPHGALNPTMVKKQGTRLVLATCGECGAKWRASSKVVEMHAPKYPVCPCGGTISPDNNEEGV